MSLRDLFYALTTEREARAEMAMLRAEYERISLESRYAEMAERETTDFAVKTILFDTEVTEGTARRAREMLMSWHRQEPDADIEIVFSSPGGSVFAGWMLFDTIDYLARNGHKVTTVAQGMAASMAGVLLQAGTHRVIGRESYLMLHEASSMALGKASELGDATALVKRLTHQMVEVFARRSTLNPEEIESRLDRRDWWLDADEALELGFVDEIR